MADTVKSALVIHPDGTAYCTRWHSPAVHDIDLLQNEVGGPVETIGLPDVHLNLWFHHDADDLGLRENPYATAWYNAATGTLHTPLRGIVLLTAEVDTEGHIWPDNGGATLPARLFVEDMKYRESEKASA